MIQREPWVVAEARVAVIAVRAASPPLEVGNRARKLSRAKLEVDAQDMGLSLPPGILHAQVENALTHAGAVACSQRPFRLQVRRERDRWVLDLRSARGSSVHRGRGTGTRYIEASLAAACPGGWRFTQGEDGADWRGQVELTCAS